jgi:hypothetical protein
MRSFYLNLKAANNPGLREDVVSGEISIVQLYGDELAVLGFALFRRHVLDRHSSEFSSFSQHSLAST